MKKVFFVLFLSFAVISCKALATPAKTDLHYSGHVFSVPVNAHVIAVLGDGDETMLVLRYGPEKGERYLAFSDIEDDKDASYGCEPSVFFAALFTEAPGEGCSADMLSSFNDVFVKQHDVGKWEGDKLTVYFSIGEELSFLFAFDAAGESIKIDTDFLSKEELKALVDSAL
ncbi:hypothetical protein [Halopseudomonas salegens]|uniref:Lipoprotein n=1 Tax=Halopseudomonas salegens TaxID=1434072 RepID=A0A1H2G8Q9_9GAMM|nr:hypothetical protein [Halopseudomonas salegens]SDU15977.1 hypothetical protein SAMN05216210_2123 [Halopseudomonas salegens]